MALEKLFRFFPKKLFLRRRYILLCLVLGVIVVGPWLLTLQSGAYEASQEPEINNYRHRDHFGKVRVAKFPSRPTLHPALLAKMRTEPFKNIPELERAEKFWLPNDKTNTTYLAVPKSTYKRGANFDKVYRNGNITPELFNNWSEKKSEQCNGQFTAYGNEVAMLNNVIVDNSQTSGRRGGEYFYALMNQAEQDEFYKFHPGFLLMKCEDNRPPQYKFFQSNHLNDWMRALTVTNEETMKRYQKEMEDVVYLAITRYEYVNLYHTMTDFYNAFLVTTFYNLTQREVRVLIVDGHPYGGLDPVWNTLFSSIERLGHLPQRSLFKRLLFGMQGYNSPLFTGLNGKIEGVMPLTEEFREFFLSSYDLEVNRKLNCDNVNILFIWRRPYLAHPRNPSGDVHRKIKNEKELLQEVKDAFGNDTVIGSQTDLLDMRDQLRLSSEADILVGMHGAALSLTMVLPKHGALLEMLPKYVNPSWKRHFVGMATWRNLIYRSWINRDSKLEYPDHYTLVPPYIIIDLIQNIKSRMCGKQQ